MQFKGRDVFIRLQTAMINRIDTIFRRSANLLTDTYPRLENLVDVPIRYYAYSWLIAAKTVGTVKYDAPLDPMNIYYVDPMEINRTISWTRISANRKADEHPRFRPPNYRLAGRVFNGDWDTVQTHFTDSTIYQSFENHFNNNVPWQETRFFEETLNVIREGARPWNCSSQSDLLDRCHYLDNLYETIATEGYKTQDELYADGDPSTNPYRIYRVLWNEIAISVGRDGELIFMDGRNRLAISRILGLDKIPVVILVRHKQWQRLRDRITRGEITNANTIPHHRSHPDIQNLLEFR